MGYLEKEFILHSRDEHGKIIPVDVPIPELGNKLISVIPVSRGEIRRMSKEEKLTWDDFVIQHVVKPKLTKEELPSMKLLTVNGIPRGIVDIFVEAIFRASGIEINVKKEDAAKKTEEILKKK